MKIQRFVLFLIMSLAVVHGRADQAAALQMAPVTVKAGPLGFIGVRLSASTGLFGVVSEDAHLRDLVIIEVVKGSAAERAGLAVQDQILQIGGVPITSLTISSLRKIGDKDRGDLVELTVRSPSAKGPRNVQVTLGARKTPPR